MTPAWSADWAWSLPLIAITLAIHVAVAIGLALLILRVRLRFEKRPRGNASSALFAIAAIAAAGWALAILHGLEAAIWAGVYLLLGATDNWTDAMLYSVDSMTTRGASGLKLERHWKMMGPWRRPMVYYCLVSARRSLPPFLPKLGPISASSNTSGGTNHPTRRHESPQLLRRCLEGRCIERGAPIDAADRWPILRAPNDGLPPFLAVSCL